MSIEGTLDGVGQTRRGSDARTLGRSDPRPGTADVVLMRRAQPCRRRLDSRAIKRGTGTSTLGLTSASNCSIADAAKRPNS